MSPADAGQPVARAAPVRLRPRLGVADVLVHLWRAKWLMLLVFLPLFALGLFAALMLPVKYTATARLLVSPAAERAGGSAENLAQSEIELVRSPVVARAALGKVTLARAYPALAAQCSVKDCERIGAELVGASLETWIAPGGGAVSLRLSHSEPAIAAELLNALTRAYLDYRPAVLGEEPALSFGAQRERFEREVGDAEAAIQTYLSQNGLSGLETGAGANQRLYEAANLELMAATARKAQREAELASYRQKLTTLSPDQTLYEEDTSRQRLQELYVQRAELRARLAPNSLALRDLDNRIARIEGLLASQDQTAATVRRGPDPLYQEVQAAIARLEAEVQAASRQQADLHAQIASIEARDQRLRELAPGLAELQRRRDVAAEAARGFGARAAQARARSELAREGAGDVRLLEDAQVPRRGESWRVPAALVAFLLAAFAAFVAGLAHALSRHGFATPGALERTTGLPVLAVIREH
ncbi:putative chain length determinant protein [Hyphomonas neptunium ATCC 15444]|uniref:Putative chain length determinant protein n=2 Tax=Hyphomonas TaxID=85 RepID=Q0C007_HYPNA|nr:MULTISPECIES: Wzz/FepE/Etk N-terminal domain-containing protein [Hyphomonas]ABI78823.1 putative chain length determinant protein [Hyphomonas neptunium ATCC 15444]KCZ86625.1 putative chain length determinant protein [Hyphomonas hirschiana VP5]